MAQSENQFTHPNNSRAGKPYVKKTFDPQIIVEGNLKHGPTSDIIVFKLRLLIIDLTCVVTVPPEGETKAPVYVKFRIDYSQNQPPGSVVISDHASDPEVRHESRFRAAPQNEPTDDND